MTHDDNTQKAVDDALNAIEGVANIVSLVDGIKAGLESSGWSPTLASQAAMTLGNTLIMAGAARAGS